MKQIRPHAIRRRAALYSSEITIERRDTAESGTYGSELQYTELQDPREIWISGLGESMQPTMAGERPSMVLIAYTLPDVDLIKNDRLQHDGAMFEVVEKYGMPNDTETVIDRYELDNP